MFVSGCVTMVDEDSQTCCLGELDNDSLALILEFTDYDSFCCFTNGLSHAWRRRCQRLLSESCLAEILFRRHGFSPEDVPSSSAHAKADECAFRRKLDQSLCPLRKRQRLHIPFTLRHHCFGFVPVLPEDWDFSCYDDPPPVSFDCDSFLLCSSGTSGELIFLNPFSTSLAVWENVSQHTTTLDLAASKADDNHNNLLEWQPRSTKQVLFDASDYFDVDINHYFPRQNDRGIQFNQDDEEQEFELSYIGIEVKPLLQRDGQNRISRPGGGTMAAVGRILSREEDLENETNLTNFLRPPFEENARTNSRDNDISNHWKSVTEILTWFRQDKDQYFGDQHLCRIRGGFRTMDVCAMNRCIYVNPWATDDGWTLDRDNMVQPMAGQPQVLIYPMISRSCSSPQNQAGGLEYFPDPISVLPCNEPVTALQVSATGDFLLAATLQRHVQIWNVADLSTPLLVHEVSCFGTLQTENEGTGQHSGATENQAINDTIAVQSVPSNSHPSAVEEIFVSRHLSIEQAGFVTLQHSPMHGSTLLYWRCIKSEWQARSRIELPISSSRFPKVHFDGRKIVVLGQDHIGFLLLIYQVLYSNEDLDSFASIESSSVGVAASGGVVNFQSTTFLRFARRIRHAALGGLEPYDPLHMTCNERFIVIATKMGNYFESQQFGEEEDDGLVTSFNEGLLVIDLHKHK